MPPLIASQDDPRQFLTDLFWVAVKTADPMRVLAEHLPEPPKGRLLVIGAGKASARMALEEDYYTFKQNSKDQNPYLLKLEKVKSYETLFGRWIHK